MTTVTIPKKLTGRDELVVISKKEFDALRAQASGEEPVTEKNILRWSREAKRLYKAGKLPRLNPRDL
ncbi:MAG: hypothetical protein AAB480_02000 [Patescibacteria group bacterium]